MKYLMEVIPIRIWSKNNSFQNDISSDTDYTFVEKNHIFTFQHVFLSIFRLMLLISILKYVWKWWSWIWIFCTIVLKTTGCSDRSSVPCYYSTLLSNFSKSLMDVENTSTEIASNYLHYFCEIAFWRFWWVLIKISLVEYLYSFYYLEQSISKGCIKMDIGDCITENSYGSTICVVVFIMISIMIALILIFVLGTWCHMCCNCEDFRFDLKSTVTTELRNNNRLIRKKIYKPKVVHFEEIL